MAKNQKLWTEEEITYLRENGPTQSCSKIAEILNRTPRSVEHKYNQLKIEKERCKVGDKVGKLTITEIYLETKNGQQKSMAKCTCDCGIEIICRLTYLSKGKRLACGHGKCRNHPTGKLNHAYTHGESKGRLYSIYNGMKFRCNDNKCASYKNYGARGVKVCSEWENSPAAFIEWAKNNGYEDKLSLDRIDNNKGYSPDNCRWVPRNQQNRNKRSNLVITAFNETKPACAWTEDKRCVVSSYALCYRISKNWPPEMAITTPPLKNRIQGGYNKADLSLVDYSHNKNERGSPHYLSTSRSYRIWKAMKARCYNYKDINYKNYGGRGIIVCIEWKDSFVSFYNWAITNGYSDELTLDRIDVNQQYCPTNCRWSIVKEQNKNKRNTKK